MADCKHFIEFEQIKLDAERYGLEPIQDPTGNISCIRLARAKFGMIKQMRREVRLLKHYSR